MKEKHFILRENSVKNLLAAQEALLNENSGYSFVFKRYFLSTAAQKNEFPPELGAVSYIIQPPLDGSTVAVWLYLAADVVVEYSDGQTVARDADRSFFWNAGLTAPGEDSAVQTSGILDSYEKTLDADGMSILTNCVRTWFFVGDIDNNYAGLVRARRENFASCGLTERTHYIASTGIAGTSPLPEAVVQMDAYAIKGDFAQTYLYAPTHLNPTYEYGVTFERGVKLQAGEHRQILISGTASIDNKGQVIHVGNVHAQALRMLENVQVLLKEAGCGLEDVKVAIVYLRNAGDYAKIAPLFEERFPETPYVITLAPVCRPDWLIEMECIAL